MPLNAKPIIILYADDDPEDRMLAQDAWNESHLANDLHFVEDGEDLMDYLHRRGKYESLINSPLPGMILLDLNMPRKDGREALAEIKSDPTCARSRSSFCPRPRPSRTSSRRTTSASIPSS